MPRPFRVESLAGSLKKCSGYVNDHDYIAKCRPADIRSALKYIDRLEVLNAELLAACEEAMLEFNDGYTAEGKGIIVEAMASAKESEGE